jgi:hypothetical protein
MGGGVTDYALAKNVSVGDEAYEFPIGTIVDLICAADEIAQLFANKLNDLVDDTTPQLGGDLDVNAHAIVSAANNNIPITPNGTGRTIISAPSETVTTKTAVATLAIAEAGLVLVSAAAAYTLTLPTAVGNAGLRYHFIKTDANYNLITLAANGAQTFNYPNDNGAAQTTYPRLNTYGASATLESDGANWQCINEQMGLAPMAKIYLNGDQVTTAATGWWKVMFNAIVFDIGSNFRSTLWVSGNADENTANHLVDDTLSQFTSAMAGYIVKNTDDVTETYIEAFIDAGDLLLKADIFPLGTEAYEIYHCEYVVPITGTYEVSGVVGYQSAIITDKSYMAVIEKAGVALVKVGIHSSGTGALEVSLPSSLKDLSKDDEVLVRFDQESLSAVTIEGQYYITWFQIKLIKKD